MARRVLVTGAGGFTGHHLVTYLRGLGDWVRGVDLKEPEFTPIDADDFQLLGLRRWENCLSATRGVEGICKLMRSGYTEPLNLGQDRLISINDLARLVAEIAGIESQIRARHAAPTVAEVGGLP